LGFEELELTARVTVTMVVTPQPTGAAEETLAGAELTASAVELEAEAAPEFEVLAVAPPRSVPAVLVPSTATPVKLVKP
jgi:hypothetical protein